MEKIIFSARSRGIFNVRKAQGSLISFRHILLPNKLKESKGSKQKVGKLVL